MVLFPLIKALMQNALAPSHVPLLMAQEPLQGRDCPLQHHPWALHVQNPSIKGRY